MKRYILALMLVVLTATQSMAIGIFDDLRYHVRLGYNIGGTAPLGMPATIRTLDKFTLGNNMTVGLDAYKPLTERWGLMAGFHYENKGMRTDARVKNYHMEMRYGDQVIEGMFTGQVVTKVTEWMLTMPIQATYNVSKKVRLKAGPYFSYVMSNDFSGYAYDGYLREGNPTGQKIELGHDDGERGDYDFTETCATGSLVLTWVPTGISQSALAHTPTWRGDSQPYSIRNSKPLNRNSTLSTAAWD